MSMDPMPVYHACTRFKKAELVHLPRTLVEPVIWIGDDDRLAMYHPAMELNIRTTQRAWSQQEFQQFVAAILQDACDLIERHMVNMGMPGGFYASYPQHVRAGMQGKVVDDE